jgi:hypothetical protein
MTTTLDSNLRYIQNPDVVLREEDADGGLLFNPDTNQVKVVNTTGLFIWKQCSSAQTGSEIATTLSKSFDDIPETLVQDVQEFLDGMLQTGFIGTVEPNK